jgi:hypothetical protein
LQSAATKRKNEGASQLVISVTVQDSGLLLDRPDLKGQIKEKKNKQASVRQKQPRWKRNETQIFEVSEKLRFLAERLSGMHTYYR